MTVVTISHQPASLAHEIARLAAEKLNLEVADHEKIHQMAVACDPRYKDACRLYEDEEFHGIFERLMMDKPAYRALFEAMNYELAAKGDVVIMGRGSQFAFQKMTEVTNVRVVANHAVQVERIKSEKGLSEGEAGDYLNHMDRKHGGVVRSIFGHDVDDLHLYDLVINTTHYGAEQGADLVVRAVELQKERGGQVDFNNLGMAKRVEALIRHEVDVLPYAPFEVRVEGEGRVVLTGLLGSRDFVARAEEVAKSYPGVTEVDNQIRGFQATWT
jgi:cytidylate kinase